MLRQRAVLVFALLICVAIAVSIVVVYRRFGDDYVQDGQRSGSPHDSDRGLDLGRPSELDSEPHTSARSAERFALAGNILDCNAMSSRDYRVTLTGRGGSESWPVIQGQPFVAPGLSSGDYAIVVTSDDKVVFRGAVTINRGSEVHKLELAVVTPWTVPVRWIDSDGNPLQASHRVTFMSRQRQQLDVVFHRDQSPARAINEAIRNGDTILSECGTYTVGPGREQSVDLPITGQATIDVCLPVYATAVLGNLPLSTQRIDRGSLNVLEFRLNSGVLTSTTGTVVGRVTNPPSANDQVAGGVTIVDSADQRTYVLSPLDADGHFRIEGLAPGPAWLVIDFGTYMRHVQNIEVPVGTMLDVGMINLTPGRMIQGNVVTEAGSPVSPNLWVATAQKQGTDRWIGTFPDQYLDAEHGLFAVFHLPPTEILVGVADNELARNPLLVDLTNSNVTDLQLTTHKGELVVFVFERARDVRILEVYDGNGWLVHSTALATASMVSVRLLPGSYTAKIVRFGQGSDLHAFTVRDGSEQVVKL